MSNAPDRIWVVKTTGWGGRERGSYANTEISDREYLAHSAAREHADELVEALEIFAFAYKSAKETLGDMSDAMDTAAVAGRYIGASDYRNAFTLLAKIKEARHE